MAEIIENKKGFKIVKVSISEIQNGFGGLGICDFCCEMSEEFQFYIPVLNWCGCPKCYEDWCKKAKRYKSDIWFEDANFEVAKNLFNL